MAAEADLRWCESFLTHENLLAQLLCNLILIYFCRLGIVSLNILGFMLESCMVIIQSIIYSNHKCSWEVELIY